MRKLFLLCALAFAVYYGASLWTFADVAAMKDYVHWLPLGLLAVFFLMGLIHIRFALGAAITLIVLLGNPTLLNELALRVPTFGEALAKFNNFGNPIESILLGLFAAWALLRMFGNPELDYEYSRARAVRALHFTVFVVGFTAVLAALHAVVMSVNIWSASAQGAMNTAIVKHPFGFFKGEAGLGALRAAIMFLEGIAVYTIVTNEVRTPRQVRGFMWLLLSVGILSAAAGFAQSALGLTFGSGLWRYNQEIHGTFSDPNSFAVFLMALLPFSAALIINGAFGGLIGLVSTVVLMAAIVKSDTKLAIFVSGVFLVVVAVIVLARAVKRSQVYPLVLTAIVIVVLLGGYGAAKLYARGEHAKKWATAVVKKVDGTVTAFVKGKWDWESLNQRTNYKLGDHLTAINMVNPRAGEAGAKNLLCGVGYGRFASEYGAYRSHVASTRGREGASNMLLQMLAETGFFGALALGLIVIFAASWAWCSARTLDYPVFGKALVWSLLMLVMGCMTENAFMRQQIQAIFWLLAGLCMVQVSMTAGEQSERGGVLVKSLIFLLIVAAWAYVMYPKLTNQRDEYRALQAAVAEGAALFKLDEAKLLAAVAKTGDYGFNRKGPDRWSEKEAYVMTKVTGPVMAFSLGCAHPSVGETNPVKVLVNINKMYVTNAVFTAKMPQNFEVDLRTRPQLQALVDNKETVFVRVKVNRTWVPAEVYPQFKEDTFDVGVALSPIGWKEELTPPAPPAPPVEEQPAAPAAPPAEEQSAAEGASAAPAEESSAAASATVKTAAPVAPATNTAAPPVEPTAPKPPGA